MKGNIYYGASDQQETPDFLKFHGYANTEELKANVDKVVAETNGMLARDDVLSIRKPWNAPNILNSVEQREIDKITRNQQSLRTRCSILKVNTDLNNIQGQIKGLKKLLQEL